MPRPIYRTKAEHDQVQAVYPDLVQPTCDRCGYEHDETFPLADLLEDGWTVAGEPDAGGTPYCSTLCDACADFLGANVR